MKNRLQAKIDFPQNKFYFRRAKMVIYQVEITLAKTNILTFAAYKTNFRHAESSSYHIKTPPFDRDLVSEMNHNLN